MKKLFLILSLFYLGTICDAQVECIFPKDRTTVETTSPYFVWSGTMPDFGFNLWVGKYPEPFELVAEKWKLFNFQVSDLDDLHEYQWRVDMVYKDSVIEGDVWNFYIEETIPVFFQRLMMEDVKSEDTIIWQNFGPGMSGYCDEFFIHPIDPNTMLMNLDMGNAYRTNNNGISWTTIKKWDENGELGNPVWTDFSRQDPDFGMALDDKGRVMKTIDRGRTWDFMEWRAPRKNSCITVDPKNDNIWYIGAGQFWRVKFIHRSLANISGTQFRNTEYGHIYKTTDRGQSWQKITESFNPDMDVARIIVDPRNTAIVYMATNFGFYKSSDEGVTWTLKGTGLPYNQPRDLQSYYDAESEEFILYLLEQTHYADDGNGSVITTGGVYKSLDGGESWIDITGNLAIDLTQINSWFALETYYKSIAYWFDINVATAKTRFPELPQATYSVFNRIVVSPDNKDEIYLSNNVKHDYSFMPGQIWKSENGGKNWFVTARFGPYWEDYTDKSYWEERGNPLGPNMEFAHVARDIKEKTFVVGCRYMGANPDGDILVVVEQQVLRSIDGGKSWKQIDDFETYPGSGHWVGRGDSNLPGEHLLVETGMKNTYLFCSGEHGLWRNTQDGDLVYPGAVAVEQLTGQSKENISPTSISAVAVHPYDTNTYYILMFRQAYRGYFMATHDAGETWETLSYPVQWDGNLSSDHIHQYSLKIDPDNPDNIYFCVPSNRWESYTPDQFKTGPEGFDGYGIYRSHDGGLTWDNPDFGLPPDGSVHCLEIDFNKPSVLYAALNKNPEGEVGGLYKSINGGDSWTQLRIPAGIISVNHVYLNPNSGKLYMSCGRMQGDFYGGGLWVSEDEGEHWRKIFYFPNVLEASASLNNPEIITLAAGLANAAGKKNPGAYLSRDGGKTWLKINYGLGTPGRIREIRPDPDDPNVLWCALKSSGWYKGMVKPGMVARVSGVTVYEGEEAKLSGLSSFGNNLTYEWQSSPEINLSSEDAAVVSFVAPDVEEEKQFQVALNVSEGNQSDIVGAIIIVRPQANEVPETLIEDDFAGLKLMPNPAGQRFRIEGFENTGHIMLFDMNGRTVLDEKIFQGQSIDVSKLISGLYIGHLSAFSRNTFFKLIIN